MKKLINAIYYSPYKDSEIYLVNLVNSQIYIISPILKDDLEKLEKGCIADKIDDDLLEFLIGEKLICSSQK